MNAREPVAELLFSPADAVPISTDEATVKPWREVLGQLSEAPKYWLATTRADRRPHVMPVLGVWSEGALCLGTRPGSVKGRNLAREQRCVITVSTQVADLVVEGAARRADGEPRQRQLAAAFAAKYEWQLTIRGGKVYEDTLPGSPEYALYEVIPTKAFGYGPDGLTATRWVFASPSTGTL